MKSLSKEDLARLAELASSVPEPFRAKCFELLLQHALDSIGHEPQTPPQAAAASHDSKGAQQAKPKAFVLPIDVRAFLSQYKLDDAILWKNFLIEGTEVRPIYTLKTTKKATAQIQHALMIALESALISGQFQAEIEALRRRCQDHKCYHADNFAIYIKRSSQLFKDVSLDQPLVLSTEGKAALADLLEEISS